MLLSGHFSLQSSNRLAAPGWKTIVFLSLRPHSTENALQRLMLTATTILAIHLMVTFQCGQCAKCLAGPCTETLWPMKTCYPWEVYTDDIT